MRADLVKVTTVYGVSIRTRHRCRVMRPLRCPDCYPIRVSIRTRHRCRVMLPVWGIDRGRGSFNPHPASLPGDAWLANK